MHKKSINRVYLTLAGCLVVAGAMGLPWFRGKVDAAASASDTTSPPIAVTLGIPQDLFDSVEQEDLEPLRTFFDGEGIRMTTAPVPSPEALADRLLAGTVDVGIFTPVHYVKQHRRAPALKPFATHVINGMRYLQGYIIVRQDSNITNIEGLRGKRFAYTDSDAFGGYLFPRYALLKAGLPCEGFFSKTVLTGDYLESLRRLYLGEVDGAGVVDEVLRLGEAIEIPRKAFRVLAKSHRVPYIAYVASPTLPTEQVDQLTKFLTSHRFKKLYLSATHPKYRRTRSLARLKPRQEAQWNINGFVTVDDKDFAEVERMLSFVEDQPNQSKEVKTTP